MVPILFGVSTKIVASQGGDGNAEPSSRTPLTTPFAIQRCLRKHPPQFMQDRLKHPRTHTPCAILLLPDPGCADGAGRLAAVPWPQSKLASFELHPRSLGLECPPAGLILTKT